MEYHHVPTVDNELYTLLKTEEHRQHAGLELIASENYASAAVLETMSSVLNNKYSEGYPGRRYYGGQEVTDVIEQLAIDRAKALFGAQHANVQPHAGAPANIATYFALAKPGDTIMGMDLGHGGHLTHGAPVTEIANVFRFVRYKMKNIETGEIDYDEMRETARREKPRIIIAGFSAYPRELDYQKIREIADEVGAWAIADVAHIAGLIVGGQLANPFDFGFDTVLTTTHKTLRGPRGGLILSRSDEIGKKIDKAIFPGMQGGPIMQMVAAKAVAFKEAGQPEFKTYAAQVIRNAQALAETLMERGARLITNGTDNHLMLIDCVKSWNLTGGETQNILDNIGITLNKNMIPDDPRKALDPSGIRIGTPALTTRGMKEEEMKQLGDIIIKAVNKSSQSHSESLKKEVVELATRFPVPGINL